MAKIIVKPHPELCLTGAVFEKQSNPSSKLKDSTKPISLCKQLLDNGINIGHACEMVGACTTCHIIVTKGFNQLNPISELEDDLLDQAWGLQANSRLSCQAYISKADNEEDIEIEIPKYTINHAKE